MWLGRSRNEELELGWFVDGLVVWMEWGFGMNDFGYSVVFKFMCI